MFWILFTGIIAQLLLIVYHDVYTNHGRKSTRDLITEGDKSFYNAKIFISIYSHMSFVFVFMILMTVGFISWYLGGFFGFAVAGLGFITTGGLNILTISYIGNMCSDSHKTSFFSRAIGVQRDRLFAMAWAS